MSCTGLHRFCSPSLKSSFIEPSDQGSGTDRQTPSPSITSSKLGASNGQLNPQPEGQSNCKAPRSDNNKCSCKSNMSSGVLNSDHSTRSVFTSLHFKEQHQDQQDTLQARAPLASCKCVKSKTSVKTNDNKPIGKQKSIASCCPVNVSAAAPCCQCCSCSLVQHQLRSAVASGQQQLQPVSGSNTGTCRLHSNQSSTISVSQTNLSAAHTGQRQSGNHESDHDSIKIVIVNGGNGGTGGAGGGTSLASSNQIVTTCLALSNGNKSSSNMMRSLQQQQHCNHQRQPTKVAAGVNHSNVSQQLPRCWKYANTKWAQDDAKQQLLIEHGPSSALELETSASSLEAKSCQHKRRNTSSNEQHRQPTIEVAHCACGHSTALASRRVGKSSLIQDNNENTENPFDTQARHSSCCITHRPQSTLGDASGRCSNYDEGGHIVGDLDAFKSANQQSVTNCRLHSAAATKSSKSLAGPMALGQQNPDKQQPDGSNRCQLASATCPANLCRYQKVVCARKELEKDDDNYEIHCGENELHDSNSLVRAPNAKSANCDEDIQPCLETVCGCTATKTDHLRNSLFTTGTGENKLKGRCCLHKQSINAAGLHWNPDSSSRCSSPASSQFSGKSSNVALSAYSTTSNNLISSSASSAALALGGTKQKQASDLNNNCNGPSGADDNNNHDTCPSAYDESDSGDGRIASIGNTNAPPPPPPPPPFPPPKVNGNNVSGSTGIESGQDSLRQSIEQRRSSLHRPIDVNEIENLIKEQASTRALGPARLGQLGAPLAAFIPPQFAAPPEDGTNIKPSSYLKRMSQLNLPTLGAINGAPTTVATGTTVSNVSGGSSGCGSSIASSKGGSQSSTPIGSLSSSSGASFVASQLASESQLIGSEVATDQKADIYLRKQLESRHFIRRRQFKQKLPTSSQETFANRLNRSQSTSALNEDSGCTISDDDNAVADYCNDRFGKTQQTYSSPDTKSSLNQDDDNIEENHDGGTTSTATNTSNLMCALRNFDKNKLAKTKANNKSSFSEINEPLADRFNAKTTLVANGFGEQKFDNLLATNKRDLIAELKESKDLDGIKRMRETYRSASKGGELSQQLVASMPVFKVEDFLEKVAENEPDIPMWRRQMLAKKAAERARKDFEDKLRLELEEKRLSQVPNWKRQMLAAKRAAAVASSLKSNGTEPIGFVDQLEKPKLRRQLNWANLPPSSASVANVSCIGR